MVDLWGRFFGRLAGSVAAPTAAPAVPSAPVPSAAAASAPSSARGGRGASRAAAADAAPSARELVLAHWLARGDDVEQAWAACRPGPAVAEVSSRLSQVPKTFLDERVQVTALAGHILGVDPSTAAGRDVFAVTQAARGLEMPAPRQAVAVTLWLWASVEVQGPFSVPVDHRHDARALAAMAFRLASVVEPAEWIRDADRRDEAARTFLFWLGYLPAGEDAAAARGTLSMRDSLLQDAALSAALADHQHRADVARRLQEARAREASARYSHE